MTITFDHVGTCPNTPAMVIEGYSPKDGRAHGSLDVTIRACADCHQTYRTQIISCGMTPYSFSGCASHADRPSGALVALSCGDRTVFETNKYVARYRDA